MKLSGTVLLAILINIAVSYSEPYNYNGFLSDTSKITDFRADSLKYSRPFLLSEYENTRIRVAFDDTSSIRFANDSVKFYYFVQIGSPILNASGKLDTAWNNNPVTIDTIDMLTAGNMATQYSALLNDGTFAEAMKVIDTVYTTGYATNSHAFPMLWDVFARIGVKGLTGNNKDSFIKLRIDRLARVGIKTN